MSALASPAVLRIHNSSVFRDLVPLRCPRLIDFAPLRRKRFNLSDWLLSRQYLVDRMSLVYDARIRLYRLIDISRIQDYRVCNNTLFLGFCKIV